MNRQRIINRQKKMRISITLPLIGSLLFICLELRSQTRTLDELKKKNTSASESFRGSVDARPGVLTPVFNAPPGRVSTEDPHDLISKEVKSTLLVSLMPWFNPSRLCESKPSGKGEWGPLRQVCANHIVAGYDSTDPAQIHKQMDDILNRHFDGTILTWRLAGKEKLPDETLTMMSDMNARCVGGQCPLHMVIMPDLFGCLDSPSPAVPKEACLIRDLENNVCYMDKYYFAQPSYLRVDGHPIYQPFINQPSYGFRDVGPSPSWENIWREVQAFSNDLHANCRSLSATYNNMPNVDSPYVELRNEAALKQPQSQGAYFWLAPTAGLANQHQSVSTALKRLQDFYDLSVTSQNIQKNNWGGVFAKFNDVLAGWSDAPKAGEGEGGRLIDADCGRTWLRSFILTRDSYERHKRPAYIQVETWNDYDEGTEIETGIDNCLADVTLGLSGNQLTWSLSFVQRADGSTGDDSTISHFDIYKSRDGHTLTLVKRMPSNVRSVDLSQLKIAGESGQLYVEAVGQPSIQNHLSKHAVSY